MGGLFTNSNYVMRLEDHSFKHTIEFKLRALRRLAKGGRGRRVGNGGNNRGADMRCRGEDKGRRRMHRGISGVRVARPTPATSGFRNVVTGEIFKRRVRSGRGLRAIDTTTTGAMMTSHAMAQSRHGERERLMKQTKEKR